jgi:hypothetical protein
VNVFRQREVRMKSGLHVVTISHQLAAKSALVEKTDHRPARNHSTPVCHSEKQCGWERQQQLWTRQAYLGTCRTAIVCPNDFLFLNCFASWRASGSSDTCILIKRFANWQVGPWTRMRQQHCAFSQVGQGSATPPNKWRECVLACMSSRTDR